jgi:glycosyltransferase involved in cell wall biosynthesis
MGPLSGLRVDLYTNAVAGGWHPRDLETGLGGSEEVIVLWSRAVARLGAAVTVYFSPPGHPLAADRGPDEVSAGVRYRPRARFDPGAGRDALVTWKDPRPWLLGAQARRRIHWSSDVEPPWPSGVLDGLDAFACLTPYHASRMAWIPPGRLRVIPHGVDLATLDAARCERQAGLALYASSPDRGLKRLLLDWPRIRAGHPGLALHVTYGWRQFAACAQALPPEHRQASARFRARIAALLGQPGIVTHGALPRTAMAALYWRAQYWLLPLETPDAELFCLNALKARRCGATPVIHRRGALADTVDAWLPYERFVSTPAAAVGEPCRAAISATPILDWDDIVRRHWIPLLKGEL